MKDVMMSETGENLWKLDLEEEEEVFKDVGELTQQIIFALGREWYGIDSELAEVVMEVPPITFVPYTPDFVQGIVNIRGNIVVVVDIRGFFGLEKLKNKKNPRIVVVDIDGKTTGLLMDSVSDVLNIPIKDIQPPLSTVTGHKAEFVKGETKLPDGRFLSLLNLEKVMASEQMKTISRKKLEE